MSLRKEIVFGTTFTLSMHLAGSAPPEEAPPLSVPALETMHVACVEVEGFPPFTDESCPQYAANVDAGLKLLSEQTGNVIKPPTTVTHQRYPKVIQIDGALIRRCTKLNGATAADHKRLNGLMAPISRSALQEVDIDFSNTGLVVGVNAPPTLCSPPPLMQPKAKTEQCSNNAAGEALYPRGLSLARFGKPVILGFTDTPRRATKVAEHEWIHVGRGEVRVGHEYVFCNPDGNIMPAVIRGKGQELGVDLYSERGSVMSYADSTYIALPHQVYLGVTEQDRIIAPAEGKGLGKFTLNEVIGRGPAGVRLPLSNQVIKQALTGQSDPGTESTEYQLWFGKIPHEPELGVYAAPLFSKRDDTPIFLIETLGAGQELTIEGDVRISEVSSSGNSVTFKLQDS